MEMLEKSVTGVTQSSVLAEGNARSINVQDVVAAMNKMAADYVIVTLSRGTEIVIRAVPADEVKKVEGLSNEDKLVLSQIRSAGARGIWTKDIRAKTLLQMTAVTHSLKVLESKKLVKVIKPVNAKTKKLYLPFDVEPSRELTGGAFYTEAELDENLISVLHDQVLLAIREIGFRSAKDVHQKVSDSGVFTVELRVEDIVQVINTMIYDGEIEELPDPLMPGSIAYKPSRMSKHPSAFTAVPCARCPVAADCTIEGPVCPQTCEYFSTWLSM